MSDSSTVSIFLHTEVIVFAIFLIIFTCGSAMMAGFAHVIFRLNGKQVVYVSLISLSIFSQSLLTVTQQTFCFAAWPVIQVETYDRYLWQWRNPNALVTYQASPNVLVQIIFNLRAYLFNVESLLFFFWTLMLFVSIWEIQNQVLKSEKFVTGTKYFAFAFPAFQVIFVNIPPVQAIPALHMVFLNFTLVITLSIGSILMGLIFFKCLRIIWGPDWAQKIKLWRGYDNGQKQLRRPGTGVSVNSTNSSTSDSDDRFILLRFLAGFIIIVSFQASFIASQMAYANAVTERKQPDAPRPNIGMTATEQVEDWAFYLASGSTGYLIFLIFGTTRESRRQLRRMWASFRGKVNMQKNEEYVSFRSDRNSAVVEPRPPTPDATETTERRRSRSPPKPMTFVNSRTTPPGSPDKVKALSPDAYKDVDLKTPRLSVQMK